MDVGSLKSGDKITFDISYNNTKPYAKIENARVVDVDENFQAGNPRIRVKSPDGKLFYLKKVDDELCAYTRYMIYVGCVEKCSTSS